MKLLFKIFISTITLQFLIAYIVWKSKYGIVMFGILNALLVSATNCWRMTPRMDNSLRSFLPVLSLLVAGIVSYYKCSKVPLDNLDFKIKPVSLVFGIIIMLIVSNDINFKKDEKIKHML